MKGGTKLWSMLLTKIAFLATSKNVLTECGQSYANAASTIGTRAIEPTSDVNAFTSAYLPVLWIMIHWLPNTTMLAWLSNLVVTAPCLPWPLFAAANRILSIRCWFGDGGVPSWLPPVSSHRPPFLPLLPLRLPPPIMDLRVPAATMALAIVSFSSVASAEPMVA